MPFFEPLPPLPEPTGEQPTGWVPPLWDRPSEATLGAPVPIAAVLATTDRVALALTNVVAYENGFTFGLVIQRNPMSPRRVDERPGMAGPAHMHRGPRVGLEFADGTRATLPGSMAPMPMVGRVMQITARPGAAGPEGIPTGPLLMPQGGGGGSNDRFEMRFWSFPLPPPGPIDVYFEWQTEGIPESMHQVDGTQILDAAPNVIVFWDSPPPAAL